MSDKINDKLAEQYQRIADAIKSEGIEYAIHPGGYIEPNTDDEELNEAIRKTEEGIKTILRIIEPYLY